MQQIERYGVIALVFLLVTIVAISFWGDSKSPGFWSRLTGKNQPKPAEVAHFETPVLPSQVANPDMPLSEATPQGTPQDVSSLGGAQAPSTITNPGLGGQTMDLPLVATQPKLDVPTETVASNPLPLVPPAAKKTPAAPSAASSNAYVVKSGDSFSRIARVQLGAESRWQEIAALNPKVDPKRLDVGQKLVLPSGAAVQVAQSEVQSAKTATKPVATSPTSKKATKSNSGPRVCTVQKGDTMRSIARRELGDERLWKEIAGANPSVDPNRLAIGARLKLPGKAEELVVAAERPSSSSSNRPRVR